MLEKDRQKLDTVIFWRFLDNRTRMDEKPYQIVKVKTMKHFCLQASHLGPNLGRRRRS